MACDPRLCDVLRGVSDGARTRDNRDHNPVLYQLSYTHHVRARRLPERRGDHPIRPPAGPLEGR